MKGIRNKFTKEERRLRFIYNEFIKSDWWMKQKLDWYSRHKKRCARCKSEDSIHLHHKKYPKNGRFLKLKDNDFVALCKNCHFKYHRLYGVKGYMQTSTNKFIKTLGLIGPKYQKLLKEVEDLDREFLNKII